MSIDERRAWELVRGLRAGRADAPAASDILVVDGDAWHTSEPVSDEARALIDLYLPIQRVDDLVIAQLGQSLDGMIATETGASHYITGSADIRRLHRLRALVDAVVVGANTVAADDPRLTVREVPGENPTRVVIDPEARLDRQRRIFSDGAARTIMVRRAPPKVTRVLAVGDEIAVPSREGGRLDLRALLRGLADQGLRRVLVEGGGVTVSRFVEAGLVDRLHVTVAPLLIGSGRPSFTLPPIRDLTQALRPSCRHFPMGDDVLFDLDFRR